MNIQILKTHLMGRHGIPLGGYCIKPRTLAANMDDFFAADEPVKGSIDGWHRDIANQIMRADIMN